VIYHRRVRVRLHAGTLAAIVASLFAVPAHAGPVPAGSVVRVDAARHTIDVAAFARTVATRYHVVLHRVVAADIDRDGDLDVVAATDRGFLVWVNDGTGRLTSQSPRQPSGLSGQPGDTWSGGEARRDETIQNDPPSTRLPGAYAHAPPAVPPAELSGCSVARRAATGRSAHIPRAPPSAIL